MDIVTIVIVLALLVAGAVLVARLVPGVRPRRPAPHERPAPPRVTGPVSTLVLEVDVPDPDHPSVDRMLRDVTRPVFAASDEVREVVVKDRSGREVRRVERPVVPDVPERAAEVPPDLRPRPAGSGHKRASHPTPRGEVEDPASASFAERFELPPQVLAALHDPDDPADVVRATLAAGGHQVTVDGPVVRVADEIIVLVAPAHRGAVTGSDLSQAFLRFQESGAPRGTAISLGYVDPDEIRRRELLAPNLRHVGQDAVQRMADAVALGGDPLRHVEQPPASSER